MLDEVVRHLRCPVCAQPLRVTGERTLGCPDGHSFDIARQGYVHLAAGPLAHTGDTAEMVAARHAFLAAGHYDFISHALAAAAGPAGLVVDAGAGTGAHLAAVLDALPTAVGLALDVSKPALRRAARAHPRAGAVLCDVWRALPVPDASASVVLDVFAPRNGPEFARVLRPGGSLLVVTPTAEHLRELVDPLGLLRVDPAKEQRLAASLAPWLRLDGDEVLVRTLKLRRAEVATLVGMGPSAWHTGPARLAGHLDGLSEPILVTAAVRLARYRRAGEDQ